MYLTKNINSSFNPKDIYGEAGDEVNVISEEHGDVLLVESRICKGFPVNKKYLSISPLNIFTSTQTIISNTVAAKKVRKAVTINEPSLF